MPVPSIFFEGSDFNLLRNAVHSFGDANEVDEDDLLAALRAVEVWRKRFTDPYIFEFRGERITWYSYESLIWSLGESFRRVILRNRRFRRREKLFDAVRSLCFDERLGKGRETFIMLLGKYGGSEQIPALIKLLEDQEICGHAVYSLRLIGALDAADSMRPFLNSPKAWVRKEALKFFKKIEPVN